MHEDLFRKLTYKEAFFTKSAKKIPGAFSVVVGIELKVLMDKCILEQSLKNLIERTQSLRLNIIEHQDELYFKEMSWKDLKLPLVYIDDLNYCNYDNLIEMECDSDVSENHQWLWNMKVFTNDTDKTFLLFNFQHSITDGQQIFIIINKLLGEYDRLQIKSAIVELNHTFNLPIYIEKCCNWQDQTLNAKDVKFDYSDGVSCINQIQSKTFSFTLEGDVLSALRNSYLKYKLALHEILIGVISQTLREIFTTPTNIAINIPFSIRNVRLDNMNSDGFFCRYITYNPPADINANQYDYAIDYHNQQQKLINANQDYILGTYDQNKACDEVDTLTQNISNNKIEPEITFSNLGDVSFGDWDKKVSYIFTNSGRKAADQIFLIIAFEFNNKLFITISYPSPVVSASQMKSFYQALLNNISQDKKF